jgi:hypothetical protein
MRLAKRIALAPDTPEDAGQLEADVQCVLAVHSASMFRREYLSLKELNWLKDTQKSNLKRV